MKRLGKLALVLALSALCAFWTARPAPGRAQPWRACWCVPRRRRSTYDELISTGEIGLIRDRALRDLAIKVYTTPMFDNIRQEGVGSRYREAFRMTVPIAVQRVLAASCGDRNVVVGDYQSIIDQLDYPCATGLPPAALREAAAALEADVEVARLLRLRIADIETRRGDMLAPVNADIRENLRTIAEQKP